MTYSYITHSKQGRYIYLVFDNDMEDHSLVVKFLPSVQLPFSEDNIDLSQIKMRDPEVILATLEQYGTTLITKGLS